MIFSKLNAKIRNVGHKLSIFGLIVEVCGENAIKFSKWSVVVRA